MGRQARMKRDRKNGVIPKKKEPVYNMTQTQLDTYVYEKVMKYRSQIVDEVVAKLTQTMLVQSYDILNCYFGFGNKRLQKFRYHMDSISEMICDLAKEEPNFDYFHETLNNLRERNIDVNALITGDVDEVLVTKRTDLKDIALSASDFEDVKRGEHNGTKES